MSTSETDEELDCPNNQAPSDKKPYWAEGNLREFSLEKHSLRFAGDLADQAWRCRELNSIEWKEPSKFPPSNVVVAKRAYYYSFAHVYEKNFKWHGLVKFYDADTQYLLVQIKGQREPIVAHASEVELFLKRSNQPPEWKQT